MTSESLKQLTIINLRGSTQPFTLPFENRKKLSIIYGENGSGKSTICDAFEFLGNGKVGSLDNRGLGKTNKYWPSQGKQPKDVSVSLQTNTITYQGTINGSNVIINPSNSLSVQVLRRNQILSLIEAKAADRYKTISPFIDVTGIEDSETTLRTLIKDLEGDQREAIARIDENFKTINDHWEAAGKPGDKPLTWAKEETQKDTSTIKNEIEYLSNLLNAFNKLKEDPKRIKEIDEKIKEKQKAVLDANNRIKEITSSIVGNAQETSAVLEAAIKYLDKVPNPSECPLCLSKENVKNLKTKVTERISDFTTLQTAQDDKKKNDRELQYAESQKQTIQSEIVSHQKELYAVLKQSDIPVGITLPKDPVPSDSEELIKWLNTNNPHLDNWKNEKEKRQEITTLLKTLDKAFTTYNENFKKQKELDVLLPRLRKSLEIVQEERKAFTDIILSQIAVEVGRIYETVHPGEGLNKISMQLDPSEKKSHSLNIGVDFLGQDTYPQAYFSESHLDTLGLCIFLALSSLSKPKETILVLDDVLASVDEPHVERLIEMLHEEAMKFKHCIITTHYRPWKKKLCWGWIKNGQCHFTELDKWTNDKGMTMIRSIPDIERLRVLLSETPPDPQLVCSKAGVILEAILDFLTLLYECAVPRKPNDQYTLGDLLPSINKKLKNALKVEILISQDGDPKYEESELGPILDELHRIAQVRNIFGCHFNTLSYELLESDAITFGENVLLLVESLVDPDAGWPKNCKSGSYWATAGETRKLHPLRKPE